jgi:hypothetical protein
MNELFQFLERVGIPAGFAYVLLFRIEPALKQLTAAVLTLPGKMHTCACAPTSKHDETEART